MEQRMMILEITLQQKTVIIKWEGILWLKF